MSAAPHFLDTPKRAPRRKFNGRSTRSLRNARSQINRAPRSGSLRDRLSNQSSQTPENLPQQIASESAFNQVKQLPIWLRFLFLLQKSSSVFTFALITITLAVYAWTVYIPKQWSKEYKKLETLQRYERQITATNETLKNQLAQQAERPEMGLARPNPSQSIFLPQVSTPSGGQATNSTTTKTKPPVIVAPVAY